MLKAVIFDFDGVVVDSHGIFNRLFTEILNKELGTDFKEEEFARWPGMRFDKRFKLLAKEKNLRIAGEDIDKAVEKGRFEYYTNASSYVRLFPGTERLFNELKEAGVKICLGSNGSRKTIEKILANLGVMKYFDLILSYEDVAHPKPAPDMFLLAVEKLKVNVENCVVIEDSLEGINAAKRAGIKVIAVSTTEPKTSLEIADMIVNTVDDLDLEKIKKMVKKFQD